MIVPPNLTAEESLNLDGDNFKFMSSHIFINILIWFSRPYIVFEYKQKTSTFLIILNVGSVWVDPLVI